MDPKFNKSVWGAQDFARESFKVTLLGGELWKQFHAHDTEMIITKTGRRMFPSLRVEISGMDPTTHYCLILEFASEANCRYKYKYSTTTGWAPVGSEEIQNPNSAYLHPDSPATGKHWMSQPISFGRAKLTNTIPPPADLVVLSSMHKYQPKLIIVKSGDPRAANWAPTTSIVFPETEFIAVTAYQNEEITKLKIDNNPFAKGFRDHGLSKSKRKTNAFPDHPPLQENFKRRPEPADSPPLQKETVLPHPAEERSLQTTLTCYPNYYPFYNFPYHPFYYPANYLNYANRWSSLYGGYAHMSPPSPHQIRDYDAIQRSKKVTDFSIKAITGLD